MLVFELPEGQGFFQLKELAEHIAASVQPIQDGDSQDAGDYFEWALALRDWKNRIETAAASGELRCMNPVSQVVEKPVLGSSDIGDYLVTRNNVTVWATGQDLAIRDAKKVPQTENPAERRVRIAARHADLKAAGERAPTRKLAQEEGLSEVRVRQILQSQKPKPPSHTANSPWGNRKK